MAARAERRPGREERRTSRNPRAAMEAEAVKLITIVTDIEQDEENFEICERFVLSNLFYHKFLDTDEHKVTRSLAGLQQKFQVHGQPEKALRLAGLVTEYSEGAVWAGHHQHDLRPRLLALLLLLAESPVNAAYSPAGEEELEEEDKVDWRALLREGEELEVWEQEEDTLSDWSEEDEERKEGVGEEVAEDAHERRGVGRSAGPEEEWLEARAEEAAAWAAGLQPRAARPPPRTAHPAARLAGTVEGELEAAGALGVRTAKITEQQVVRELLWMLRCPADSPLFSLGEAGWRVRPLVTVPSLTAPALASLLGEVLPGLAAVHALRAFTAAVEEPELKAPRTLEAYAGGLTAFLQQFSSWLCELEGEVTARGLTLLAAVDRLRPWVVRLAAMAAVHGRATLGFRTTENWYKSIRLLSVLYNSLSNATARPLVSALLELLVSSLRPYLAIVQGWLAEGRLEDWRHEFIIHRRSGADGRGEDFWHNEFLCRDYGPRLLREGIQPLGLLQGLDTKILVSGKSIELLNRLDHIFRGERKIAFTDSDDHVEELYPAFLSSLQGQLGGRRGAEQEEPARGLDPELRAIVESADCPYLALAMEQVFLAAAPGPPALRETEVLPEAAPDPLLPLPPLLRRALAPSIQAHYRRACHTLVDLFITELQLESVLSRARSVFFLEAGDLMHHFCSELFQLLEPGAAAAGAPSLSLLLQDALGPRYPAWADTFTVERRPGEPGLAGVRVHMAAPWPLALVFTRANLDIYNKVFLFLAGVKRSLWALQSIRVHRLRQLEEQQELDVSSLSLPSQDISLPLPCKQHRLQLLRSWLLYFTTTVHGYFMSRVVHTTEVELRGRLATATDLDMILTVHQEYLDRIHDRCFLHPSAAMLREAVTMVLGLGVELQQATLSELPIHTQSLLAWEERYMQCHKFLASTLQTMTGRRRLPHLEGLTVALLHSCPA